MKQFVVEEADLDALEAFARRLYTENRMNGDEMREGAKLLDIVISRARKVEVPEGRNER